jgi:N-acetylglucosaminyldiphosphoundecaprenol N-acetyl-beta-D-mannosaminyltransferase
MQFDRSVRANVLGVGVHAITMEDAVATCIHTVQTNGRGYVCETGVHGVIEAQCDSQLRDILNRALLNLPDGMPTVWMGWLQNLRSMRSVRGPEFMLALCQASVPYGFRHFLCGGGDGVAELLAASLRKRFPGITIAGTYTPPFRSLTAQEEGSLAAHIQACAADIVWVGLSTPKQERFMSTYSERFAAKVMVGVGAAFDFHSGRAKDAPAWIKSAGLHWFYRLLCEPRRLWRRYCFIVPAYLFLTCLQVFRVKRWTLRS